MAIEGQKLPRLLYNPTSAVGAALGLIGGFALLVMLLVGWLIEPSPNPYFGIFIFLVLPAALLLGLVLIPVGMLRERRRRRREGDASAPWPVIDLNQSAYRNALFIFVAGTIVFLIIGAAGTYGAYHYSESVAFCGTTCHQVMEPEYTTYQRSPHARVKCVSCHVGSGASWYVKSKLSGAYQMYAVAAHRYPRPIPTPIESLRPARDTCEQCHWPEHVYGAQQRQLNHYMYDAANTHWPVNLLLKIGGGDPQTGQTAGIHWHMNIGVKVEYVARDPDRQDIPWVRVTDRRTGRVTVYQTKDAPLAPEEVARATPRVMDCMDCHNRPSHIFRSPDEAIDLAILTRRIEPGIPGIKTLAVQMMSGDYASREEALRAIANGITDHYRKEHPEVHARLGVAIDQAILATQEAYATNVFPVMKARWSAYPANIGHLYGKGCMRCHDGNHVSEGGVTLTRDCRACHIILSQGSGERMQVATSQDGLEFVHPEDIGELWKDTGCHECHSGTKP